MPLPAVETFRLQPSFDAMPSPIFKVVAAYEDLAARDRASKIHEQIEELCRGNVEVSNISLSFADFDREQSLKAAVAEAAAADMIVISATGANELPTAVADWIETWPRREQSGQDALVLVLDSEQATNGEQQRLAGYLQKLAGNRGLDFFCNHNDWASRESIPQYSAPVLECHLAADSCQTPIENWGIND